MRADKFVIFTLGAIGVVTLICKLCTKPRDRSSDHYGEILKLLTPEDMDVVDQREKNGETLADILDSLRLRV